MNLPGSPFLARDAAGLGLSVRLAASALPAGPLPAPGQAARVRAMLTGGSPLPDEVAAGFERQFSVPVRNILGMTESAGLVSIEPLLGPRTPGSAGLRLPYTEVLAVPWRDGTALLDQRPELGPLADPGRRASCLSGLGYPAATPILGARTIRSPGSQEALVLVLADRPGDPGPLTALAVSLTCSAADTGLLGETVVPAVPGR